jgi:hypothetical protein
MTEQSAASTGASGAAGNATTHPVWCDQGRCTALAQQPAEYAGHQGEHRSAPVNGPGCGIAFLTQAIAPWECSVHLRIENNEPGANSFAGSNSCSFPLEVSSPLLLMMRQHIAVQKARWPSLMPALGLDGQD